MRISIENCQFVAIARNWNLIIKHGCASIECHVCRSASISWKRASQPIKNQFNEHFSRVCNFNDNDQSTRTSALYYPSSFIVSLISGTWPKYKYAVQTYLHYVKTTHFNFSVFNIYLNLNMGRALYTMFDPCSAMNKKRSNYQKHAMATVVTNELMAHIASCAASFDTKMPFSIQPLQLVHIVFVCLRSRCISFLSKHDNDRRRRLRRYIFVFIFKHTSLKCEWKHP